MKCYPLRFPEEALKTMGLLNYDLTDAKNIEIGCVRFLKGQRTPSAVHDAREISIILNGMLEIESDGEVRTVKPGAIVEIPPHKEHSVTAPQDTEVLYILIK